jgi:hypothetical protein
MRRTRRCSGRSRRALRRSRRPARRWAAGWRGSRRGAGGSVALSPASPAAAGRPAGAEGRQGHPVLLEARRVLREGGAVRAVGRTGRRRRCGGGSRAGGAGRRATATRRNREGRGEEQRSERAALEGTHGGHAPRQHARLNEKLRRRCAGVPGSSGASGRRARSACIFCALEDTCVLRASPRSHSDLSAPARSTR